MSVILNLIYRSNSIPIKVLASYFVDIDKVIIKFTQRRKRSRIANTMLKEKNEEQQRINTTQLQNLLQNYSNQENTVLVKE